MSIEIMRGKSEFVFRINPHQPREIDKRVNKRGARWERYTICASEESAVKTLFRLQNEEGDDE